MFFTLFKTTQYSILAVCSGVGDRMNLYIRLLDFPRSVPGLFDLSCYPFPSSHKVITDSADVSPFLMQMWIFNVDILYAYSRRASGVKKSLLFQVLVPYLNLFCGWGEACPCGPSGFCSCSSGTLILNSYACNLFNSVALQRLGVYCNFIHRT